MVLLLLLLLLLLQRGNSRCYAFSNAHQLYLMFGDSTAAVTPPQLMEH